MTWVESIPQNLKEKFNLQTEAEHEKGVRSTIAHRII